MLNQYKTVLWVTVLTVVIAIPLFLRLDVKSLREWDEARNAINAYEMSVSGNYLVKTYNYQPDLWETKPPLLVWLQCLGFKLLGYNELAVRLPSAIAALALALLILYFSIKHLKLPVIGIVSLLILVTSPGFVGDHCSRTGDHDALLLMFEMIMLLYFFNYSEKGKKRHLIVFGIAFFFAMFTKSIAVFMLFPGILLYLILTLKIFNAIKDYKLWLSVLAAIAGISIFYIVRENASPGYLKAVWNNELFPRYFNTAENYSYEKAGFWYYLHALKDNQYSYWLIILPFAWLINFSFCKDVLKRLNFFLTTIAVLFFIIISLGTSNMQYDLILIPIFSVITGIAVHQVSSMFRFVPQVPYLWRLLLKPVLIIAVFYLPYSLIISKVISRGESSREVQYAYVMKAVEKQFPNIKTWDVFDPSASNYPLVFYKKIYNDTKGYKIGTIKNTADIKSNQFLLILNEKLPKLDSAGIAHYEAMRLQDCLFVKTMR
ncbi:MAG: glycosyltransferase family 39 protein [Bacteroidota bacterium]